MNNDIKCVIFDLDGTLLYTLEDLYLSTNFALCTLNFAPRTLSEVRSFVGNGIKKLIERAVPEGCDSAKTDKCLEIFIEHYCKNSKNHTRPYDGIIKVLKFLYDNNIKVAVNSNKIDSEVKRLCKDFFGIYINAAVGESAQSRRKPYPDGVNKILAALNCKRENTLYVGDSLTDIKTAQNAQIPCISVSWGYCDKAVLECNNPKRVIENTQELLEFFKENINKCKA